MNDDVNIFGLSIADITFNLKKLDTILKLEQIKQDPASTLLHKDINWK